MPGVFLHVKAAAEIYLEFGRIKLGGALLVRFWFGFVAREGQGRRVL